MSKNPERIRPVPARVSATEAAKNFGRLVDRVRERQVSYVVERSGIPVARIEPAGAPSCTMAGFKALIGGLPRPDEDYLRALEAIVARHKRPRLRRNPWER